MNKKTKIVLRTIGIIFLIIIIFFVRKYFLLTKIMNHLAELDSLETWDVDWRNSKGFFSLTIDGTKKLAQFPATDTKDSFIVQYSKDIDKPIHPCYTISVDDGIYILSWSGAPDHPVNPLTEYLYEDMTFKDKIIALFTWKIRSEKFDGKKCYYVCKDVDKVNHRDEYEFWLDKENYCKVKATTKDYPFEGVPEETIYYRANLNPNNIEIDLDSLIAVWTKVDENFFWKGRTYDANGKLILPKDDKPEDLPEDDDISNDNQ